jgi:hypothetical protein
MADYREVGEVVKFSGHPAQFVRVAARYDYDEDRARCPICGGIGLPWLGWFTCDENPIEHVGIVETGEMFERCT